jgi:hypothetical protein
VTEEKLSQTLRALEIYDGTYKREYVNAAIEMKEEITPYLIEILEKVLSNPAEYVAREDYHAHIYALMLLGHFGEHRAHKTIVELFSLPGDIPDKLFGDIITEDLPVILFRTCDGLLDMIRSLVLNRGAYEFCRGSAIRAITFAVAEGIVEREGVLDFFGSLFTGDEADPSSHFWDALASDVCALYPEELMDTIKKAYQDGLISPGYIQYKHFEKALQDGKEICLEKVRKKLQRRSMDDLHRSMSWWACFDRQKEPFLPVSNASIQQSKKNKKKAKKKKRRKMAKASKRKNR